MRLLVLFVMVIFCGGAFAQTFTPVAVTGFNMDVVAEGTGSDPTAVTSDTMDQQSNVVCTQQFATANNFNATLPAAPYTWGLPDNGVLTVGTRTYRLEPYTGNEALNIWYGKTDSLTLVTPRSFSTISLATIATETDAAINITFRFADGTTKVFNNQTIPDWFDGTGNTILNGFGRLHRSNNTPVTQFSDAENGNPYMYYFDFALPCSETLVSIIFKNVSPGNTSPVTTRAWIFAVSGVAASITPPIVDNDTICTAGPVQLAVLNPVAGASYHWYASPTGALIHNGSTYSPTVTKDTVYYVAVTSGGCTSQRVADSIIIGSTISSPALKTIPTICTSGSDTLVISSPQASATYNWYNVPTGGVAIDSGTTFTTPVIDTTTTYYLETISGSCVSNPREIVSVPVTKPTSTTTTGSLCPGSAYIFNGKSYDSAGTYTDTISGSGGCDSIVTLVLSVRAPSFSTTIDSTCANSLPFTWNGNSYDSAGTYTDTLTNAVGCDSIATLILALKPTTYSTTKDSVYAASFPFAWNGNNYDSAGTYNDTLTNAAGCDSIATLILVLKRLGFSTTTDSVCAASLPFVWNGKTYPNAGTYTDTLIDAEGSDSIATLVLVAKQATFSTTTDSTCPTSLPFVWNGDSYANAGTYTDTLTNAAGCDSIATLVLFVKQPTASTTIDSLCPSSLPFAWNGKGFDSAGTYTDTLTNAAGCDSIATLVLFVKRPTTSSTTDSVCQASLPFNWNGKNYSLAGTYTDTLTNAAGCDSIATLTLVVTLPTSSVTKDSICVGAFPFSWNGHTYNAPGTDTVHLTNAAGCDSAAVLVLTQKSFTYSVTPVTVCTPSLPYSWNGKNYDSANTYYDTLTNSTGCDSIAALLLTVNKPSSYTQYDSICLGGAYQFNGKSYDSAGTYTANLTNAVGCDSLVTLVLAVKQPSSSTTKKTICVGQSFSFNGSTYDIAGNYSVHFKNSVGCDSAANLVLTVDSPLVVPPIVPVTYTLVCVGDSIKFTDPLAGGIWSSQDSGIAKVDSSGIIKGMAYGTTNIIYTDTSATNCGSIPQQQEVYVSGIKPTSVQADSTNPNCLYPLSGSITVNITGLEPTYTFTVGGYIYNSSTVVTNLGEGSYPIYIHNENNCLVDSIALNLVAPPDGSCDTLYVPTGFTPGANENNKLRPFGGLLLKSLTFMVYNRYGNLVYESHSVYTEGWDGTIQGHPQETGTYVWYLDYVTMGNYRRTSKGTSVLIR